MTTKTLKPESIPLSIDSSLSPTRALYLQHQKHANTTVHDLTPHLHSLFSPKSGPSLPAAQKLISSTETPSPPILYTLHKESIFGTHLKVKNGEGKEVAEWKSPILSFHMGRTTITFLRPDGFETGEARGQAGIEIERREVEGETVEVKPAGIGRRAEVFTKDGVPFIWEAEHHKHEHKMLCKVLHSDSDSPTKLEIARFCQPSTHSKDGLLVLDAQELDILPAVLTLCAMLENRITSGEANEETTLERLSDVPVIM